LAALMNNTNNGRRQEKSMLETGAAFGDLKGPEAGWAEGEVMAKGAQSWRP
jgi:hypothetical protein